MEEHEYLRWPIHNTAHDKPSKDCSSENIDSIVFTENNAGVADEDVE